jgi:hypothetical protein
MYGIYAGGLPASPAAIYVVGLVLELIALGLIQAARARRLVQHRHRASAA